MKRMNLFQRRLFIMASIGWSLLTVQQGLAEQTQIDSRVTDVTLFRSQAMVTRTISVDLPAGASELVVSNLPENIDATSLFAEGNDQLEVRAVQFRTREIGDHPREEVQALRTELETIETKIAINRSHTELINRQNKYLDKLEGFVAPTAHGDLSKGVLDADSLKQVTLFAFEKRQELLERQLELTAELKELTDQEDLLDRKLATITNGITKTIRDAVVFVHKNDDAPQSLRLNYLVNGCGWSPSYTARAATDSNSMRIEYNGLIRQMSGEDWNNVTLTLSSASPALSATGPGLAPFRVTLTAPPQTQAGAQVVAQNNSAHLQSLLTQQREYNLAVQNSFKLVDNFDNNWQLNGAVNQIVCAELTSDSTAFAATRSQLEDNVEQPAMNYTVPSPVTLASRANQQMVRILATELESEFYHVATPILTSYVYREAEIDNGSQQDLMAGPITVYLDNRFVGRSEIPTVTRGQTFVIGLGADSQIRTRRDLVDRQHSFTGGNREINMQYRLVVENYKDKPVNVRIIDRVPMVDDESNVRVTMLPLDIPLSENESYVRLESPKGILRWDTEVAAGSTGAKAYEIEYGFTLEHDRQYQVSLPSNLQKQKQEFQELQNIRIKR